MTTERQPISVEQTELTRRSLLSTFGVIGIAAVLGGDAGARPQESPIGKYNLVVGLGDSYTAGLGASTPENGYVQLVRSALDAKDCRIYAKNGSTARDMLTRTGNAPNQIDLLPAEADLVLMTIGGNATNLNLRTFGAACIAAGCGYDTLTFKNAFHEYDSDRHYEDLEASYRAVLKKAEGADVGVPGYSKLLVPYKLPPRVERFLVGVGIPRLTVLGYDNDAAVADLVEMSNTASQEIIRRIDDPRLVYIPPPNHVDIITTRLLHQPDNFHVDLSADSENAGHPTDAGYRAMARAVFKGVTDMYNRPNRRKGLLPHGMGMGR